ncbi:canalicular multispecific organic anion transporter 2 [Tetranychus urticae]|uniref:Uncharacterized protein n=1 Tax=Tetranychus urticae TaxID=32264 RepID=T1K399_TETUR|nr:canalicular multispecific organic anion transporter 2 [Tetranychus urticae]
MRFDSINFVFVCGNSSLWEHDSLWSSSKPGLTQCFKRTILNWLPTIFLWFFCFFEFLRIAKVKNKTIKWNRHNFIRVILCLAYIFLNDLQFGCTIYKSADSITPVDLHVPLANVASLTLIIFFFYYHRLLGIHTSAVIWIYCFLQTITTFLITYQTWIDAQNHSTFEFIIFNFQFGVILSLLIVISFADGPIINVAYLATNEQVDVESKHLIPENEVSFLNQLTFWWFNSLIFLGRKRETTIDDLWDLPDDSKTENLYKSFEADMSKAKRGSKTSINLVSALLKKFWGHLVLLSIFQFLTNILSLISPLFIKLLINFIEKKSSVPIWHGFMIAGSMFIVSCIENLINAQDSYLHNTVGEKVFAIICASIFRKSLYLGAKAKKKVSSGKIVNLMTSDSQKFYSMMFSLNDIWSIPLRIICSLLILYSELGYSAFVAIFIVIGASLTVEFISKLNTKLRQDHSKINDKRIESIYEILNSIRIIKFYVWEESFIKKTNKLRKEEMELSRKMTYMDSLSSFFWTFSSSMVSVGTFAVYVLVQGGILTAQKAFVSLSYLSNLKSDLIRLFYFIISLRKDLESIKRVNEFLNLDELDSYVTRYLSEYDISVENADFKWSKKRKSKKKFMDKSQDDSRGDSDDSDGSENEEESVSPFYTEPDLKNINMNVKPGSFVVIVGSVGSGKSSLLSAILGEMEKVSGLVNINGKSKIAYVSQQAWIQNATIRDNILFENPFNKTRYEEIISVCALEPDLAYLPKGDKTEIGEKGINLSGGQKQRISLARACYSDADIFIMDDPLSAVDAHVSKHLFNRVLNSESGILRDKTRVLVTNKLDILSNVDYIYVLNNGRTSEAGTYQELVNSRGDFYNLVNQFTFTSDEKNSDEYFQVINKEISLVHDEEEIMANEHKGDKEKDPEEDTKTGRVKWPVYLEYFRMISFFWIAVIVISKLLSSCSSLISDIWLSKWSVDHLSSDFSPNSVKMRLAVYAGLELSQGLLTVMDCLVFFHGSLNLAIKIHQNLLFGILRAPIAFFDRTSTGTIITLFSRDLELADSSLLQCTLMFFSSLVHAISHYAVIFFNIPLLIFVLIPICLLDWYIQRIHNPLSRQLQRISSSASSPIYSHFSETLNGLNTIQAFGATGRFISKFSQKYDRNVIHSIACSVSSIWLDIRLNFCGHLIKLFAVIFVVLRRESIDSGVVGLILTYALNVTSSFSLLVRYPSYIESNAIGFERLLSYSKLESEADWYKGKIEPEDSWPEKGSIKFDRYETRYTPKNEPVLKGITAFIKAKEKIGIVGRTGAGKSTITLSLFRLLEPSSGAIYIDNYNISDLPLHFLRSRLAIIPQDPVLFAGTLRFNLDPFCQNSDNDIWSALSLVYLKDYFTKIGEDLDYNIDKDGANLSVGQKQLLCLARALLKKPKILILDEATAAIDLETDNLIQKTIRSQFKDCTILTIAHRLHTILDSDRVMVLDNGQIVEFDVPKILLDNKESVFYSLAKDDKLI